MIRLLLRRLTVRSLTLVGLDTALIVTAVAVAAYVRLGDRSVEFFVADDSLVKTLAMRHRTTTAKIRARLSKGTDYEVSSVIRGEVRSLKLWRLKHLRRLSWTSPVVDNVTKGAWWVKSPNDLIDRLDTRECGICGDTRGPFVVHHRQSDRHFRDKPLTNRNLGTALRRTMIFCPACREVASSRREIPHMESRVH